MLKRCRRDPSVCSLEPGRNLELAGCGVRRTSAIHEGFPVKTFDPPSVVPVPADS